MSKYTEELKYFSELQKNCTCKCCGGELRDVNCFYCGSEMENAKFIIDGVKSILDAFPKENIEYSTDINLLYKMKNISVVNKYIKEIDYDKVLEAKKQEIFSKDYNNLTDDEIKDLEFLTKYFLNENERKGIYNDALFDKCLNGKNRYSLKFIEDAYLSFSKEVAQKMGLYGDISTVDLNQKLNGRKALGNCGNYTGKICIDRKGLIKLSNGDPNIFTTFFHELRHREQNYMVTGKIDNQEPAVLLWAKEKILADKFPDYYENNYEIISFESDAIVSSLNTMLNFNKIKEERKEEYTKELHTIQALNDKYRTFRIHEGKILTVEDIFNEQIKMTDSMLRKFPIFNYQYIKDENGIRHRTIEEINDYMNLTNGKNLEGREKLREYLISAAKENIESNDIKKV